MSPLALRIEGLLPLGRPAVAISASPLDSCMHTARMLRWYLQTRLGIRVGDIQCGAGSCGFDPHRPDASVDSLGFIQSPAPLLDQLRHMMQTSDNLFAESEMRQLARFANPRVSPVTAAEDAVDAGIRVVREWLVTKMGVPDGEFYQRDGSGMSRRNLVTTGAIAGLLQRITQKPWSEVSGRSETLSQQPDKLVDGPVMAVLCGARFHDFV